MDAGLEKQLPKTHDERLRGFLRAMAESRRHNVVVVDDVTSDRERT